MTRSTILVTLFSLINLTISFVSQLVISALYGVSGQTDAYFVATTLPLLIFNLFSSIGSMTIVPIFTEVSTQHGAAEAWKFVSTLVTLVIGILSVFVVLGMLGSKELIELIAPGLSPSQSYLASELFFYSGPMVICMTFSGMAIAIHNAREKFALPSASMILLPLGVIIGALLLDTWIGIRGLVIGQLIGSVIQALILSLGIVGIKKLWLRLNVQVTGLKSSFKMIVPQIFGGAIYLSLPTIERFFASGLPSGNITHLSIAARIGNLVAPLLTTGLATTLFPRLSKQVASNDKQGAYLNLSLALRLFLVIAIPIIILSPIYALPMVQLLFERGEFSSSDSASVAAVVPLYLLALTTGGGIATLVARGFLAILQNTLTLSVSSAIHVVMYIGLCVILVPRFGYIGLAFAYTIFWCSVTLVAILILRHRLGGGGRTIVNTTVRCVIASSITYVIIAQALAYTENFWFRVIVIVFGFVLYVLFAWFVLRISELYFIFNRLINIYKSKQTKIPS